MQALELSVNQQACCNYRKKIFMIKKNCQKAMRTSLRIDSILKSNPEQTYIGVWIHDDHIISNQQKQIEVYLSQLFYYYQTFDSMEKLASYFGRDRHVAKIFFIISISNLSSVALAKLSEEYSNTEKIYIFSPLIISDSMYFMTNDIDNLFAKMKEDILAFVQKANQLRIIGREEDQELRPFYISRINRISTYMDKFMPDDQATDDSIKVLKFLMMTNILLNLVHDDDDIQDMWQVCRQFYQNDPLEQNKIEDLSDHYEPRHAIYCYTKSSSVFRIVNDACRTENIPRLYEFRVYINHLHQQIDILSKTEQDEGHKSSIRKVYRGRVLSESVLQQLIDNEKKLISMNGFLSTTLSPHISNIYAAVENTIDADKRRVQFILTIDTVKQPYASISSHSAIKDEEEVLFSIGIIWRIDAIRFDDNLYQIELTSSDYFDTQLETLMSNYIKNECNLSSIGDILQDLGNYEEADWFYMKMLKQNNLSKQTCAHLYYKKGIIEKKLGRNGVAFEYFQQATGLLKPLIQNSNQFNSSREIYKHDTDSLLIAVYNNMALLNEKNYAFDEAFNCYKQALEISNSSKSELAIVNNNLGLFYCRYGSYQQARKHFVIAIELSETDLLYWPEFKRNLDHVETILRTP
ncbi:hypothetical protein I4U23_015322 [Adineta vaga]|nr:hypothetical protein I4U23_015322 [Adineta vaga]